MAGLEERESLFTPLKTQKMIAEKYPVRHFSIKQQALGEGELGNASWLPGTGALADGLTKVRSGVVPLSRLLESGVLNPGYLRPLRRVARKELVAHGTHLNSLEWLKK